MSAEAMPPGGTMKSAALTVLPAGVATLILPEPVAAGTANASAVDVTDEGGAGFWLSLTVVAPAAGSKPAPLTVTTVPARTRRRREAGDRRRARRGHDEILRARRRIAGHTHRDLARWSRPSERRP